MYEKALELGAKPVAPERTKDLLSHIERKDEITLLVAPGNMGEKYAKGYDIAFTVIGRVGSETSAEDTKRISMDALKNPDYMRRNVQRLPEQRDRVWRALNELGDHVYRSTASFLLVRTEIPDAVSRLREIGILVSDPSNQMPSGFIRVSIGTRKENDTFISGYMRIPEAYE